MRPLRPAQLRRGRRRAPRLPQVRPRLPRQRPPPPLAPIIVSEDPMSAGPVVVPGTLASDPMPAGPALAPAQIDPISQGPPPLFGAAAQPLAGGPGIAPSTPANTSAGPCPPCPAVECAATTTPAPAACDCASRCAPETATPATPATPMPVDEAVGIIPHAPVIIAGDILNFAP